MSTRWETLGARARGLAGRLLTDAAIGALADARDSAALFHELESTPYAAYLPPRGGAPQTEVAVDRLLADRLGTLARWSDPSGLALRPVFLEQDASNVRVVLRGVLGELAPEERLAGSIPTPTLGRRGLQVLARAESAGRVAATLVTWGHPLGSALLTEASRAHPDLFRLEHTLMECWAREASVAARHGGRPMRRFVAESVDAHNVATALVWVGTRSEGRAEDLFVEGGLWLTPRDFARAAMIEGRLESAEWLAWATRGTLFEAPLRASPTTSAAVSSRILDARIRALERDSIREPLTALPVLLFILRLRREARLVRRASWAAAFAGGPR